MAVWLPGPHLHAATFYWDADGDTMDNDINGDNLGGTGTWNITNTNTNWWNLTADVAWPNATMPFDNAIFTGIAGTVTLDGVLNARSLQFSTGGYTLTGGTLTLGDIAQVNVAAFSKATISSVIAGSAGLNKTGNGSLVLTNAGNTFGGDIVINGGNLVVNSAGALGTGTTAISVNGVANTGNPGFSGGSLILNGVAGGFTVTREISVAGRGPGAANASGGLVSIGNNTIGDLVLSSSATEGRVVSSLGTLTVAGNVQFGAPANLFYGNGNFKIDGIVSGYNTAGDTFIKTGNTVGSTLSLQNANNNFAQPLRIDSGTVRVSSVGALGLSYGNQAIDLNGGILEVRSNGTDFSSRNIRKRGNGGGIFVDHAIGSHGEVNQNFIFGNVIMDSNSTFVLSGRNGAGAELHGRDGTINWTNGNPATFQNSSSGLLIIDANINRLNETTARNLTFSGNGDFRMTGNILQTGTGAVNLVKTGLGYMELQGTASTATGTTQISQGTLAVTSMNGMPSGALLIGNASTVAGAFKYIGSGETSSKAITLNTTTAGVNAHIYSSGTGALVLNGTISALTGNKTFVLGGSNTGDNTIASAIPAAGGVMNLQKTGSGTWVLDAPSNNLFTGSVTISNGLLKLQERAGNFDLAPDAGAVIFNVDTFTQSAGGRLSYLGASASASTETMGALTATAGHGQVLAAGTGGGSAALTFASLGTRTAGATLDLSPGTGGSIIFT
ncbi:MAG: autotransporter-associated beta strand repeat-containing protein, partial [Gammaproteobacteria bacterium]|nr:autotransporter-associated beta strand repeat-containing protein [Gammaproteobacteria bacterium]